jgi:HSP20 family protein
LTGFSTRAAANSGEPLSRRSLMGESMFRRELTTGKGPAVDIAEKDNACEVIGDVPGFDEKSIEVQILNGPLWIDSDKIEATLKKGVLTATLPKTAEGQRAAKKIEIKEA